MSISAAWLCLPAAGLFLALHPTGALLVGPSLDQHADRLTRFVLRLAVGSAVWSLLMLASIVLVGFHPVWLGALGWAAVLGCWWHRRSASPVKLSLGRPTIDWPLALLVVVTGTLYLAFPKESIVAERDEAIYTVHALHLLQSGEDRIDLAKPGLSPGPVMQAIAAGRQPELRGLYADGSHWIFQFSALPAAWIAQLVAIAGEPGLYRLNGIVGVASLLTFFCLIRALLPQPSWSVAWVGAALFALNPAQVWVSRTNLSEPLSQWFTLCAMLCALLAFDQRSRRLAACAGALFGLAVFCRVDALLNVLLLLLAFVVYRSAKDPTHRPAEPEWAALLGVGLMIALLACAYFRFSVAPYWVQLGSLIRPLLVAIGVLVISCFALGKLPGWHLSRSTLMRCCFAGAIALLLAFAYAWLLRPQWGTAALVSSLSDPGGPLRRDYRELSLINLEAYLHLPVLLLALVGAWLQLWRLAQRVEPSRIALPLVLILGCVVVFLWRPMVSPDHVWAVRRWVPLVIPGTILLACISLAALLSRLPPMRHGLLAGAIGVLLMGPLLWAQRHTLLTAEDAGLHHQVAALAARLTPHGRTYVSGDPSLAATLLAGFGLPVVPLPMPDESNHALLREELGSACTAVRPCQLLSAGAPLAGLDLLDLDSAFLDRRVLRRTPRALANQFEQRREAFTLARFNGLDPAPARSVGAHFDLRFPESGFSHDESSAEGLSRWTTGAARIELPTLPFDRLEFRLLVGAAAPSRLRLAVNGKRIFDELVAPGRLIAGFDGRSIAPARSYQLQIDSDAFNAPAPDGRRLGVKVEAIRLMTLAPPLQAGARYQSRVRLLALPERRFDASLGGNVIALRVMLRNTGDSTWPAAGKQGQVTLGAYRLARGVAGAGERPREQHFPLPYALTPGEDVVMSLNIRQDGQQDADSDIILSPVHEGQAWFIDAGPDNALRVRPPESR